ncbi:Ribose transport system permease protein RbsC [Arthrobacter sp. 9V]|uniref:ABC transporter permease n=1 Tax=Arthrobacter sp. 9V TaxID=2653132 RepID=UPI0012F07E63|nr:ABC transporter permease [Arthrobacter sp. 9V]VXC43341.1 Ribose transport system permease protein RbsC [Arthrobacter sp. 9V]
MTTTSPAAISKGTPLLIRIRRWNGLGGLLPLVLLIALYFSISIKSPGFLSAGSMQSVATQAAPLVFLAAGLTPIIILGGIDLSLAALTTLSSILIVQLLPPLGLGGLLLVLLITTAFGAVVGFIHAVAQVPSFVVTLGAFGLYGGLALQISNATNQPLTKHLDLVTWTTSYIAGIPASFVAAVAFVILIWLAMTYLPLGRYTYAVGASESAALMSGIRTVRLRVGLFALAGLSAGLAALPLVGRTTYGSPSLANTLLLPTIAAVVVGGTAISGGVGSVLRSLVGALIVTVVQVGLVVVGVNAVLQNVVFGAMIVIAVALTTDRSKLPTIK